MEDRLEKLEYILTLLLKDRYVGELTDEEEEELHKYFVWGIE